MEVKNIILHNLATNEEYSRKILPFIKVEYFQEQSDKIVFTCIRDFILEYNDLPTKEAVVIALDSKKNIYERQYNSVMESVDIVFGDHPKQNQEWLMEETEKFCKDRAVYNAIMQAIEIIDGKEKQPRSVIPEILTNALSVSFDSHIGHEYYEDYLSRYEFYHRVEEKIPFDIDYFNHITAGGMPRKTLFVVMAPSGVGKSIFLCHHAAACLKNHKNVLYITCEMSEEKIAQRIDCNILDMTKDELTTLPKAVYEKKMHNLCGGFRGRLIVKEYPTASANVNHFRFLLDELELKKKFKPDVIFIDYLNICVSSRIKPGSNSNSYSIVKSIAEEVRGLAVEYNVPIFSATQINRDGYGNTDPDMSNTSESMGLAHTVDMFLSMITTEELEEVNQIMFKQLKNRDNADNKPRKFIVGLDKSKMKLYNIDPSTLEDVSEEEEDEDTAPRKFRGEKKKVSDWNF
jgi:replicative DNA helicase